MANATVDVWFMRDGADTPYVLHELGVPTFTIHDNHTVALQLGQGHARGDTWWEGDLDKLALHYPPCAGDVIEYMQLPLDDLGLDAGGLVVASAIARRIAADRAEVNRQAEVAKRDAEYQAQRRERWHQQRGTRMPAPPPPSERQRRISELRTSISAKRPAVWEVETTTLPEPARPPEKVSWTPTTAFTVDLACVHCGGAMGVLTTWPSYMGVPRSKHPLQCTECNRLSGAPCPCAGCAPAMTT